MRVLLAASLMVLAALVAPAVATAQATQATQVTGVDDEDKMICKNQARTGTRFAKRTCRTKGQWELMRENARRQAEEEFNRRMIDDRRGN